MTRSQPTSDSFEGTSGQSSILTVDLTYNSGGGSETYHRAKKIYFDSTFNPRGSYDDGSGGGVPDYAVVSSLTPLPASALGAETGTWHVLTHYSSSAKTVIVGTTTVTYEVHAGVAAGTVLLVVKADRINELGALVSSTSTEYWITRPASGQPTTPAKVSTERSVLPGGVQSYISFA
ncbi:hypothetical protein ACS5PN_17135 [Roseateles sp. NT4]|uniref:hypothetical protein n=1 Tax=Roseateles sp. NT4 TaxID=3453715 RepID=UPI003EE82088